MPEVYVHDGPREDLRGLFELAEDSAARLDTYLSLGEVLVATLGERIVGHVQVIADAGGRVSEIRNMAVRPEHRQRGIGRSLVTSSLERARRSGHRHVIVATAAADTGNLRFYQRLGFRMARIERDAFTPATGYASPIDVDGIELRDRVWLDIELCDPGGP